MRRSDAALLERWAVRRDAEAFAEVVSRYAGMVYGTCQRILGNPTEAEDVTQDCFMKLSQAAPRVGASLGGWLHKVATNRCLDYLKTEHRRRERETKYCAAAHNPEGAIWEDLENHVDEAIAELPEELRLPIIHHFLEGQTHKAVAKTLGISRSGATRRIQRGVHHIRESLKRRGVHVAAMSLAAVMAANLSEAAPATLIASLGKLALAGTTGSASTGAATTGGLATSKLLTLGGIAMTTKQAVVLTASALVVLSGVLTYSIRERSQRSTVQQPENLVGEPSKSPQDGRENRGTVPETDARSRRAVTTVAEPSMRGLEARGPAQNESLSEEMGARALPASISGHVIDDQAYAVAGAKIELHITTDPLGHRLLKTYTTQSRTDGTFDITGIDTFGYGVICASAEGYATGSPYRSRFQVDPGTVQKDLEIMLQLASYLVSGRVVSDSRQAIPGAAVKLVHCGYNREMLRAGVRTNVSGSYMGLTIADQDGRFQMAIEEEGLCDFSVTKDGYGPGLFAGIATGTTDALFVLRSPGAIAGTVTRTSGEPVEGARVDVLGEAWPGGLIPDIPEYEQRMRLERVTTLTDSEGRYRVDGLGEEYLYVVKASHLVPETANIGVSALQEGWVAELREVGALSHAKQGPSVRKGVRVRAGETTNVNLVLLGTSKIFGQVTATDSGLPVHPLGVYAYLLDAPNGTELGQTTTETMTDSDGWYALVVDVDKASRFSIRWKYVTFYGIEDRQEDELPPLTVRPDEERRFDFSVPASVTVPVRFVDQNGEPRADVYVRMQNPTQPGKRWGQGAVDAEGRTVLRGLPPGEPFQVLARTEEGDIVGASEPFVGEPGQTLPEITVVCDPRLGGIEAAITDALGNPVPNVTVLIGAVMSDGGMSDIRRQTTDGYGRFTIVEAFPEAVYTQLFIGYQQSGQINLATIENVEILASQIMDIGEVAVQPISAEEWHELSLQYPGRF